jgi:ketosteroid isomerase-like protein
MEGEIQRATSTLVRSLEHGDASSAARVYAEDARVLAAGELIRGRVEIEAYWQAGIALGLSTVAFERRLMAAVADKFIEIGRYAVAAKVARNGQIVDRGTYLALHAQVADGSWRRAVDVFNADEPITARRDERREEPR